VFTRRSEKIKTQDRDWGTKVPHTHTQNDIGCGYKRGKFRISKPGTKNKEKKKRKRNVEVVAKHSSAPARKSCQGGKEEMGMSGGAGECAVVGADIRER